MPLNIMTNSLLIGPQNKTDLLLQLFDGQPLTIIDTTGDVARAFGNRAVVRDTLYFDPTDITRPVGINVLDGNTERLADYIFHLFPAGATTLTRENVQFLLDNCLRILHAPHTLLSVLNLLSDKSFREQCIEACKDKVVRGNWAAILDPDNKPKAMFFSLRTKIGKLLSDPVLRNMVGQPYDTFPPGITIIANLDRAKIGNDRARFLGAMLLAKSSGCVVIPDLGFLNLPIPFEENRFIVGVNFLEDLAPHLQREVLAIDDKYVFKTNKRDAEELAHYVNVVEIRNIMDLNPDQFRTPYDDRPYTVEPLPSLKRLKPLKKKSRAAHTAARSEVEKHIEKHLWAGS